MIIYETMPFLQRQLTVFKQDDAVVFVSLADDGRQEFLADDTTAIIQAGHVPELDLFRRYAAGESVDFRTIKIDYLRATPFQRAVWTALHEMGPTETLTYSDLAERANYPKAIRAVATAVGKNPRPLLMPVIRFYQSRVGLGNMLMGPRSSKFYYH